ncbi:hypothetical protein [Phormidium tenue]|uniref:Uncharacterized protein n=1 Tax=Phormidium tenue FACHB-1050 TaxID=2692857 RepID=A0ABR8C8D3_9CYAN|nr:hypothetical protein [Phormidium tenue]MBD2316630.1 hypothetical protein [Phormidium tenue FACHB-1050]
MTWFKLHHEIVDDIKIRRFSSQEKWAWIVLLCLASKSSDRGTVTADNDDLADYCEFNSTQDWLYYRDKLITKGMLEISVTGCLKIVHWDDRQSKKPSDDPARIKERVAKSRAKKKSESASRSQDDVTRYIALQSESNADVSPQIRLDQIRSEEIRRDQIKQDPHINNSCVRVDSQISNISKFEQRWKPQDIDCGKLAQDIDFREFVLNRLQKLPSAKKGEWEPDMADAAKNISSGQWDLKRRGEIKILYEEYIKSKNSKASSAKNEAQSDRPRLRKPNPMTWTAEQHNWTYEQWEKFLNEQNSGNAEAIYASY